MEDSNKMNKMTKEEMDELISAISPKDNEIGKIDDNFYEAYGEIDKMHFTKEELRESIKVLTDIIMLSDKEKRDRMYLFTSGFREAKKSFLVAQEKSSTYSPQQMAEFEKSKKILFEKFMNVRPAIEFLIRMNEII